jgi:hypothetical protein
MPIQIPINKKRTPFEIIFGLLACTILYLLITRSVEDLPWYYLPAYFILLFYCLFFTILVVLNYLKALLDKSAGIIITEKYLYKNISVFSSDNILWSDIEEAKIFKGRKRNILILKLADSDKYLRNKNFLERYILKKHVKRWGTPILISDKTLDYDLNEVKQLITDKLKEYSS